MRRWRCAVVILILPILLSACAHEQGPPAPSLEGGITVRTDWSKLEKREEPLPTVGKRWYEDYTGALLPRDDYGMLIPYAGQRLMDDWPAEAGCIYGLMTADGVAITDPVFSSVTRPGYLGEDGLWRTHPLLLLAQGDPDLGEEEWNPARFAVADCEGRWITSFDYRCVQSARDGLLLFQKDRLILMSPSGEELEVYTAEDMGLTQAGFDSMVNDVVWGEGAGGNWYGDYLTLGWWDDSAASIRLFQRSTGQQVAMPYSEWNTLRAQDVLVDSDAWQASQLEVLPPEKRERAAWTRDALLGDNTPGLLSVVVYSEPNPRSAVYRMDGTPIPMLDQWVDPLGGYWYRQVGLTGGLIEVLDLNTASYYRLDTLECVFRTYLGFEAD